MSPATQPTPGALTTRTCEPTAAWVLLRGLTRESGHWGDFPKQLQQADVDTPVVCIDLPGNGVLNRQTSPTHIPAMTDAARAQLQAQGLAPPYRLLAMSLGAMVAADWATRHPGELRQVVMINTSLRPFSPWHHRLRPGRWAALLGLLWPGRPDHQRETTVFHLTSLQPAPPDGLIAQWARLRRTRPVSAANAARQLLAALRYRAPSRAPGLPLLVLASTRDRLVNVGCSRALARHWQLPLREHPWAGHDLPLDDPAWVVAQVHQAPRSQAGVAEARSGDCHADGPGGPDKPAGS